MTIFTDCNMYLTIRRFTIYRTVQMVGCYIQCQVLSEDILHVIGQIEQ